MAEICENVIFGVDDVGDLTLLTTFGVVFGALNIES